jgi:hypothetical protein
MVRSTAIYEPTLLCLGVPHDRCSSLFWLLRRAQGGSSADTPPTERVHHHGATATAARVEQPGVDRKNPRRHVRAAPLTAG